MSFKGFSGPHMPLAISVSKSSKIVANKFKIFKGSYEYEKKRKQILKGVFFKQKNIMFSLYEIKAKNKLKNPESMLKNFKIQCSNKKYALDYFFFIN